MTFVYTFRNVVECGSGDYVVVIDDTLSTTTGGGGNVDCRLTLVVVVEQQH